MKKIMISASITPLLSDGSLDKVGFKNLLERNIKHNLDGIFIFGTMGEWYNFTDQFKEEAVEYASSIVKNRTELMVGVTSTSLPLSLKLMNDYKKYDFGAYVYMLPAKPAALDVVKSTLAILDNADRPVYFYYNPALSCAPLTLAQFDEILAHPNLKGIKNSSGNMFLRKELLLAREEKNFNVLFLEGHEWAIDEAGFMELDGSVCGIGALASKMLVAIRDAAAAENWQAASDMQKKMIRLFHGIYGKDLKTIWTGQKYAMYKMGIISSPFTYAEEMSKLTDDVKMRIENCIAQFKDDLD
jgi:4-hydroxy-tetrahydrodipicolinate synthase